jgi:hypothetical protein
LVKGRLLAGFESSNFKKRVRIAAKDYAIGIIHGV